LVQLKSWWRMGSIYLYKNHAHVVI
jgi:hypothetical protein